MSQRSPPIHRWQGSEFDPKNLRLFSILPDEEGAGDHCVRHDRPTEEVDAIVRHKGGLYTTADGFGVYVCRACMAEVDRRGRLEGEEHAAARFYQTSLANAFELWDGGDAPATWFKYIGEGDTGDLDAGRQLITFGGDDD